MSVTAINSDIKDKSFRNRAILSVLMDDSSRAVQSFFNRRILDRSPSAAACAPRQETIWNESWNRPRYQFARNYDRMTAIVIIHCGRACSAGRTPCGKGKSPRFCSLLPAVGEVYFPTTICYQFYSETITARIIERQEVQRVINARK
ncbi:hypothetical protein PUN28_006616 [Cardiocondyla obscurior]|uniref:Uncharacterized protein n=1 Tax=Cardiocondyla obscurior TaxID=286306 RepID=A0AAW2GBG6_9HYME